MPDKGYSDDISGLWGPTGGSSLEPARPPRDADALPVDAPITGSGNGLEVVEQRHPEAIGRLAEALAAHKADVATRADLARVRSELEGTFTHQLAVALYDLMVGSDGRFTRAEVHLDQRLNDIAERLTGSVEAQTQRLMALIDVNQRAVTEANEAVRAEVAVVQDHLSRRLDHAPLDAMGAFQRDIRHEVGRLADTVAAHGLESTQRDAAQVEQPATARGDLSRRMVGMAADRGEELADISTRIGSVQDEVATLHEEIAALREAVEGGRRRVRRRRRS